MKKLTSVLLAVIMVFTMSPAGIYASSTDNYNDQKLISQKISNIYERKMDLAENQKKLSSDLVQLLSQDSYSSKQESIQTEKVLNEMDALVYAGEARLKGLKPSSDDLVYVYIKLNSNVKTNRIDLYANTVISRDEENSIAAAWVEKGNLEKLASLGDVQSIRTVLPPIVRSGSTTSQGDGLLNADVFRELAGTDGSGVKIGVISDGVNNMAAAQASGDLPDDVQVLRDDIGGDEGTAMLEIIHDLAPGAELYFHDLGGNTIAFNEAINNLVASGCSIVCDDIGWPSEPYFEDGIIAKNVSSAISQKNIVYVSSAGNDADNHYQGKFLGSIGYIGDDPYLFNDFSSVEPEQQMLPVYVRPGGELTVVLQWNDKFGSSANDYDLILWDTNLYPLAKSVFWQNGDDDPIEGVIWKNNSNQWVTTYVDVIKASGSAKTLEIFAYGGEVAAYGSASDSIYGHPAAQNAIAVGALNASAPGSIAYYSSQGPSTISYPSAVTRKKPDLSGIDGVSVTGAGGFSNPFYGTSAAAPHIAAVAALVWSQNPDKKASEIRSLVCNGTIDLGAPGADNVYGSGRSDVVKAGGPLKPSGISASPDDRKVTLSWKANTDSDLAGYQIEYKTSAAAIWTGISVAKTVTSYTITNLVNNMEYQFRFKAKDISNAYSVYSNIITDTPYATAKIAATVESTFKEGSEDGKKITVALTNGTFISNLDTGKIQLTGLPKGVTKGAVTRTGDNALTISMVGNSTEDYDSDITAQLTIAQDQVSTYKPADLSCTATLKATVEPKPAKPLVTFSYDGANASQLKGIINTMEYSLDGGNTYIPAVAANQVLTGEELYRINADKDIRVRVAATFRAPESDPTIIAIAPGPASPAVTGNDIINMVSGMTTSMEFTTNTDENTWEWGWTRYVTTPAPNNLPLLNGDKELKVRIAGKGATMPSVYKLIEFHENEPLEVNATYNGLISDEGNESGKLITVTLVNGQFVSSINRDMIQLTGLPSGISKGEVKRIGDATVTIALSKNSTYDYDTDYETTIKIDKNQILPLQPDNIKTSVILPAFDDAVPEAPNVTFSYKTNPGKLMGSDTTMEYSLNGGEKYITVSTKNMLLTSAQLASLDPAKDIRIRVKASLRAVAGEDKVLNIDPVPGLPPIDPTVVDSNNNLAGINTTMEFSIDKGKTWKAYNGINLPADLTGNLTMMVRYAATDSAPAGPATTYPFTATNPLLSINAGYENGVSPEQKKENEAVILVTLTNGKFTSKLTATEIKVSGLPSGVSIGVPVLANDTTIRIPLKGNAAGYYDVGTVITVSVGKGQVLPAQPAALTTTMRLLDTAKDPAPTGIAFSFATDTKGVVTATLSGVENTMEYSLDGGVKYSPILTTAGSPNAITLPASQTAVITKENDIRVRFKAVLSSSKSASNDYLIEIEKPKVPSITNDDAANSINGINHGMSFSIDGGKTWSKYTETDGIGNLPKLEGNLTLMVKLFAQGYNLASNPVTLTFTSTSPGLSIRASSFSKDDDSPAPIIEGSEGSQYIIVTLTNGKFASTVSSSTVKVTGLPAGVTVPANGFSLINNTQIKMLLQGISTADYDNNKTVTIMVDRSQLLPAPQPLPLTTTITFNAVDESIPAAPVGVDFSFDGSNAKKITGVNNTMEYSLDGGVKYTAIVTTSGSPNAITLTAAQVAAITVDKDIRVRYKAVAKTPASNYYPIGIVKPGVPEVTYDDNENTISGIDNTMEFSTDGGKTWKVYSDSSQPADPLGNITIKVRTFASGHYTASDPLTLTFTSARPALAITADFLGDAPIPGEASYTGTIRVTLSGDTAKYGKIIPSLTQTEIKLVGLPTGIKQGTAVWVDDKTINIPITGTNVAYYDMDKAVTISIGKAQVKPVQATALAALLIFPGDKSERSDAPSGIGFSINTGKMTGVNTTMEYSLNGGSTYIAVAASPAVTLSTTQISSITADNDILVRHKSIPATKTPASLSYVIDITKPAAPEIGWSDETNTITSGIDSAMEFSTDGGKKWTACIDPKTSKNNVTAKDLTGNLTLQIRLIKDGTSVAGEAAILSFTAINPELTISGEYSGTTEGEENGNTITVTLVNGKFVSSLKTAEVVTAGLPKGVTVAAKGGVTRLNDTQIRILLSGNSTEDYDNEKVVTVTVGKTQLLPAPQIAPVVAEVSLPVTNETTSEAPMITFSFSGNNAGKLIGITTAMEYSIDGGTTYTPATASNVKMSNVQLAGITAKNGILVRVKATLRDPAGEAVLIKIAQGPEAPDVTADDANDTVIDLSTSMEYSKNNGLTWIRFNGSNAPVITGNATLLIRLCAADTSVSGDIIVLTFSQENPKSSISAAYDGTAEDEGKEDGKKITVTLTDGEFVNKVNSSKITLEGLPEGVTLGGIERNSTELILILKGNSEHDYDSDLNVTVKVGKNQVIPSQMRDLICITTLPAMKDTEVQFSFDGDYAGKLIDTADGMEYSLDGGDNYIPVSDTNMVLRTEELESITAVKDILVRYIGAQGLDDVQSIDIVYGDDITTVTANDADNLLTGINETMEFSTDHGSTWTRYHETGGLGNLPDLSGELTILLRKCAAGNSLPGEASVYTFGLI